MYVGIRLLLSIIISLTSSSLCALGGGGGAGSPGASASSSAIAGGFALSLTGSSAQYVSVPTAVWFNGGPFTIEAWVNPRSIASWYRIMDFSPGGPGNSNVLFAVSDGTSGIPCASVYNGNSATQHDFPSALTLNVWTHLAITMDSTGFLTMYQNGVSVSSFTAQNLPISTSYTSNYIGKSNWDVDGYFDGYIDDFRMW